MPVLMVNSAEEIKAKFDAPDFVENNEEMLKEEFSKYFEVMMIRTWCFVVIHIESYKLSIYTA